MNEDLKHIEQVINGNHHAFGNLVAKYQNYVFTVVYRILKSQEDAEEAAQDVFVKAFKTLKSFKKTAKFSTWLYRIAHNTAIDYTRKRKHLIESLDQDEKHFNIEDFHTKSQFEVMMMQQQRHYIEKLIDFLSKQDGLLISLFYLKEHSIEEIAVLTQLSKSNVKVKLLRIRKKLRKQLEKILKHEAKELL